MKNRIYKTLAGLIWTITLLSFAPAKAQDYVRTQPGGTYTTNEKKFSLKLSVGAAIPLGDFASTNVKGSFWDFTSADSTRLQGFATTGFHFDFSFTYYIHDFFGIAVMIGDNINGFDVNAFSNTMGYQATTSTATYSTSEYLIGPVFNFNLANKLKLTAAVYVGFARNNYPQITLALNDTLNYTRYLQNGMLSFAYSVSTGISYSITDYMDLTFDVAYTGAVLHYPSWIETLQPISTNPAYYYLPAVINHSNNRTTMVTGILKPCVGIALRF